MEETFVTRKLANNSGLWRHLHAAGRMSDDFLQGPWNFRD